MHNAKTPRISTGCPTGSTGPTPFLTLSYRRTGHRTHSSVIKDVSSLTEEIGNQWDQWDHPREIKRLGDTQSTDILGPYWGHTNPSGTAARAGGSRSNDASPAETDRYAACLRSTA